MKNAKLHYFKFSIIYFLTNLLYPYPIPLSSYLREKIKKGFFFLYIQNMVYGINQFVLLTDKNK